MRAMQFTAYDQPLSEQELEMPARRCECIQGRNLALTLAILL